MAGESGDDGDDGDRAKDRRSTLQTLVETAGLVATPLSVVGSALVYFGAVEVRQEASVFGVDPALLGYSNQELIIRAVAPMMMPVAVGCVLAAVAIEVNAQIGRRVNKLRSAPGLIPRLRRLRVAGGLLIVAGMVWQWHIGAAFSFLTPPLMAIGAVLVFGARSVELLIEPDGPPPGRSVTTPMAALDVGSKVAFGLMILFAIFGLTARLAQADGTRRAAQYMSSIRERPTVSVLSKDPLSINQEGVACLAVRGSPFTRRYVGFRLLAFRQGRYFLVTEAFNRNYAVTTVLVESPDLRLEYDATRSLDGRVTPTEQPLLSSRDPTVLC